MTKNTQTAIAKYSAAVCLRAFEMHAKEGYGARSISLELRGLNSAAQANAAINAGRELSAS
jgi:hypothetical protein